MGSSRGSVQAIVHPHMAWDREWEVRKGRSERTQEFGDWYEMYDKAIDSVFYVNDRFNKTQWKSPFS